MVGVGDPAAVDLGVALVMRDGRGLRLTPAGGALAERARAALALLDEAVAAARGTRATAEAFLDDVGISPRILTLGSNGAVVESVRIGPGVTLISADAVAGDLTGGRLEEWRHPGLPVERPWHLLARAREPLAPTPERFLAHGLGNGWDRRA